MTDKRPFYVVRRGKALHPYGASDYDMLSDLQENERIEISVKRRRSLPQLAAYFVMLHRVVEATGAFPNADKLHQALKLDLGFTTPIKCLNGEIIFVPDSVAFNKMTAVDFRAFFAAAEKLIAERFGIDVETLHREAVSRNNQRSPELSRAPFPHSRIHQ